MSEWIIGLRKAAKKPGKGVAPRRWAEIESRSGRPAPPELRELYQEMDGAFLPPDVRLWRLEGEQGVLAQSALGEGRWVFGLKGGGQELFAEEENGQWRYFLRRGPRTARGFRSLEELLTRLVPPAETEEFGDRTFSRALGAVQGAIGKLELPAARRSPRKRR